MVNKEEFEERYKSQLERYEENFLKEEIQKESHPGIQALLLKSREEETLKVKIAREQHFEPEAKMRAAYESRKLVDWIAAIIGNNVNLELELKHRLGENGNWDHFTAGDYLNMSFQDLMDIVSNTTVDFQGEEIPINNLMTIESKEALIQAIYERIGYTEHLPTEKEIKELEEQGKREEAIKAKQIAGMGNRNGPISYVNYGEKTLGVEKMGEIYSRTSPQEIEQAMKEIKEEKTEENPEQKKSDGTR